MAISTPPKRLASDVSGVNLVADEIIGEVMSIREYDGGFAIIALADGRKVVGEFVEGEIVVGVSYRFFGQWRNHEKFGQQFAADSVVTADDAIQGRAGIVNYLYRSNVGLSRSDAERLFAEFGAATIRTVVESPQAVAALLKSDSKAEKACNALKKMKFWESTRIELFQLFAGRGVPKSAIQNCIDEWGKAAPKVIRHDPFRMLVAGIPGIGFKRADELYLSLGKPPHRLKRVTLAGWYGLRSSGTGNTWDNRQTINKAMLAAAPFNAKLYARAIELGIRARWIMERRVGNDFYYAEWANAQAEERVARHILRIMRHTPFWPTCGFSDKLSAHQREKIESIIHHPIAILAGAPGTGKTFVSCELLQAVRRVVRDSEIGICAPTGKAAVRITDVLQSKDLPFAGQTIHSMLGVIGDSGEHSRFRHDETRPLPYKLVLADEQSMSDVNLMAALLAAIPPGGNLLLVGDPYQLPPVGHGAPFRDMLYAGVPHAILEEIQRQAAKSAIVRGCHEIKNGKLPAVEKKVDLEAGDNLIFVEAKSNDDKIDAIRALLERIRARNEFDPIWDVQVLVARNKDTLVSRETLNPFLQRLLNSSAYDAACDPAGQLHQRYLIGDKVICLKNQSGIAVEARENKTDVTSWSPTGDSVRLANGDVGRVLAVDRKHVIVAFMAPERIVKLDIEKNKFDLDLAYACTVHKYQGSEVPVVILPLDEKAGMVSSRNWIYTAISRAKTVCFLIGSMSTIQQMIGRDITRDRRTFLVDVLRELKENELQEANG